MEKKLKFSEFAELIGVTAKTVYKMKDREEIKTVIEKVNGREIQLVVTNTEEIKKFRSMNGKGTNNNGNYEDMLTDNERIMENNNASQITKNNDTIKEIFDKMLVLNDEYINRLNRVSEELTNERAKVLYLENKAGREGEYIHQINELSEAKNTLLQDMERLTTEKEMLLSSNEKLESEQSKLRTRVNILTLLSLTVIVAFLLVLVGTITYNVTVNNRYYQEREVIENIAPAIEQKKEPAPQTEPKKSVKPAKQVRK